MMVGHLLQEDHGQKMWKYCLVLGGLSPSSYKLLLKSAVLSAVCGRYGIEVRKEGVSKSCKLYLKDPLTGPGPGPGPGPGVR
eukprot:scaffold2840_cov83-Skeletonema_dohrnii-CCMP3373.AAC.1